MQLAQAHHTALPKDKISQVSFIWAHWSHVRLNWLRIYLHKFILLTKSIKKIKGIYTMTGNGASLISQKAKFLCSKPSFVNSSMQSNGSVIKLFWQACIKRTGCTGCHLCTGMIFSFHLKFVTSPVWAIKGHGRHCSKHNQYLNTESLASNCSGQQFYKGYLF